VFLTPFIDTIAILHLISRYKRWIPQGTENPCVGGSIPSLATPISRREPAGFVFLVEKGWVVDLCIFWHILSSEVGYGMGYGNFHFQAVAFSAGSDWFTLRFLNTWLRNSGGN